MPYLLSAGKMGFFFFKMNSQWKAKEDEMHQAAKESLLFL